MGKFKFTKLDVEGMFLIEPTKFGDDRGYFMETYSTKTFADIGITNEFVQDNQSASKKGVLRGLHFQINFPQDKLVRVVKGEVFDVAVWVIVEDNTRIQQTFRVEQFFDSFHRLESIISQSCQAVWQYNIAQRNALSKSRTSNIRHTTWYMQRYQIAAIRKGLRTNGGQTRR